MSEWLTSGTLGEENLSTLSFTGEVPVEQAFPWDASSTHCQDPYFRRESFVAFGQDDLEAVMGSAASSQA